MPTQSVHQPCLLLYENKRGSSSVYEVAHTGQARLVEYTSKRPMLLVSARRHGFTQAIELAQHMHHAFAVLKRV